MSTSKSPPPKPRESSRVQQSDIIIRPDGEVVISFLWDDLGFLAGREARTERAGNSPESIPDIAHPRAEYESCRLCPKKCGVNRLERAHPTCGDFELRVANSGLTHGDEPEIRGTRGSGAVMLSGCPLRCPSCHNPEMVKSGEPYSIGALVALFHELASLGAHNVQILSPTSHLPALREALAYAKRTGFPLPFVLKSSGYELVEEIEKLEGLVDIYLPDFKFGPCSAWGARAGARKYFETASAAVAEMFRQVGPLCLDADGVARSGLLVRHVLAPLPSPEREEILAFLRALPPGVRVSLNDNFQNLE